MAVLESASATVRKWIRETDRARSLGQVLAAAVDARTVYNTPHTTRAPTVLLGQASPIVAVLIQGTQTTRSSAQGTAATVAPVLSATAMAVLESASKTLKTPPLLQGGATTRLSVMGTVLKKTPSAMASLTMESLIRARILTNLPDRHLQQLVLLPMAFMDKESSRLAMGMTL